MRAKWMAAAVVLLAACSAGDDAGPSTTNAPARTTAAVAPTSPANPTAGRPGTTSAAPTTTALPTTTAPSTTNAALDAVPAVKLLLDAAAPLHRYSLGADHLGVWICHVALDIDDPIYNAADLRLDLTPDGVAGLLNEYVAEYYRVLTHDLYQPEFVVGGEVSIVKGETNRDCVDQALHQAADDIDGVLVVADAEHGANQPGGWGRPGDACGGAEGPCPARQSGRATYIGASDFHEDWGPMPAVDLQEHELGHSLGFPHSGDENRHTSALDLMSNSAAPRDVDPDRRHAPDTLAVNRLAAGWLDPSGVAVAEHDSAPFVLSPSNGTSGTRLLVLPLDDERFLTVELIENTGFDSHLPEPGVAIHLIDQQPIACGSSSPCVNEFRRQVPMLGPAPHTDLLQPGEDWTGEGWTVTVVSSDDTGWTVEVR